MTSAGVVNLEINIGKIVYCSLDSAFIGPPYRYVTRFPCRCPACHEPIYYFELAKIRVEYILKTGQL